METFIVDPRKTTPEESAEYVRQAQTLFSLNHTMPFTPEYDALVNELFDGNIGDGSRVMPGLTGVCFDHVKVGSNVVIMNNCLMMSRGGITIEDNVLIAANVQLISNNHDLYDRAVLQCKPVLIKEDAWLGAGVSVLPGVCIGKHAVVGAGSVVTKDIPDYAVAVGSPAKVVRMLNPEKFA